MAIIIDGVPVTGSQGHSTYSRNRYGAYKRNRVKPINPTSAAQTLNRNAFRAAVDAWTNDLTNVQRAAWDAWALATPWLNKAGQTVHLTGQAAFIRKYSFQVANTLTISLAAPIIFDIASIDVNAVTVGVDGTTPSITFNAPLATNPWNATGGTIIAGVSVPQNVSANHRPSHFQNVGGMTVGVTPAAPVDLTSLISMPSFGITIGTAVWVALRAITPDGRVTERIYLGPTVVQDDA